MLHMTCSVSQMKFACKKNITSGVFGPKEIMIPLQGESWVCAVVFLGTHSSKTRGP